MIKDLSALILTHDEEPNIGRCLDRLRWVPRVVVLDSGSTDRTVEVASSFANVEVFERPFDSFAGQCNHGLGLVQTGWVLSLDCDYMVTPALAEEIQTLQPPDDVAGYRAGFRYCIEGRPLRGTLYPPRTVLYRVSKAGYEDHGHGHKVALSGRVEGLAGKIDHDDRKPLGRWLRNQMRYAELEAEYLLGSDPQSLPRTARIRRGGLWAPWLVAGYVLLAKGVMLDGRPGLYYAFQRVTAELLIALQVLDRRLRS